jgi:gliding motility-associated-like protein
MMSRAYLFAFIISFFAFAATSHAQLSVNGTMTPAQLVQNVLLGPGITATNITYTGAASAIGFFNGLSSNIGLDSGVVLTSGSITNAVGPNTQTGITTAHSTPGDTDLDALITPTPTFDACVLQFDFIPIGDSVKFRFVFASDEYPEYANSGINDCFGFFLTGVTVPFGPTNLAVVPNTTTPITINTINCQNNSPYYVCNDPNNQPAFQCPASYACPTSSVSTTVEYDGFTTVLTAKAAVICGETYHIKIAIADGADQILDSGVFLEAGSFKANQVTVTSDISYGGPNDTTLFEGCGQACLIFDRGQANLQNADTVTLAIGGAATNGVDYTSLPSQLIFAPGQDSIVLCVQAASDNLTEGMENLTITIMDAGPCALSGTFLEIFIGDYVPLSVTANGNSPICPGGNAILYANPSGGAEPYNFSWSNGSTDSSIYVTPSTTTTYSVTVTDACNASNTSSSFTVEVSQPLVLSIPDQTVCLGNSVTITPGVTGGAPAFYYIWETLSGPDSLAPTSSGTADLTPTANGTYQLTIWDNCNTFVVDQFAINVQEACEVYIPNVFSPNGDNANDNFVVKNLEKFPNSELMVYNRWGNKIYHSTNYQNDWNGDGASDGVYYFVLHVSDGKIFRGFVTILR